MPADTIYAVSSGTPPAAIAILRISGPDAMSIGRALVKSLPEPRRAGLRALRDPGDGALLDRALILVFPAPRTATGEDLIEFHMHGGRAVVAAVEAAIGSFANTRRAEPGEFTRRALENGVIDLTAAEGLGDLLAAQTESQRRAALRMAEGGVRFLAERWTDALIAVAARVEAQLDFVDSDDVATEDSLSIGVGIAEVSEGMKSLLAAPAVERLHEGVRVVIAGPPNSGKSTLLNALSGRDLAIVSPISGTTRDRIEASVVREGVVYILTDTAGLTVFPGDAVEAIGVGRAEDAIVAADIVLWLADSRPLEANHIPVHARADAPERAHGPDYAHIAVSGMTGAGIHALWIEIARRAASLLPVEDSVAINRRQRSQLGRALAYLVDAVGHPDMLVVAEQLRLALHALHGISGRGDANTVLDAIFSKFCIGK